jgi:hypothetical protein
MIETVTVTVIVTVTVTVIVTETVTVTVNDVPLLRQFCNGNVTVTQRCSNDHVTVT